jgi:hypothetical protein
VKQLAAVESRVRDIARSAATVLAASGLVGTQALADPSPQGLRIQYFLPKTLATVTATYLLESCDGDPLTAPDGTPVQGQVTGIKFSTKFVLSTVAVADTTTAYYFDPGNLGSTRVMRNFTLQTDGNGVIKSINSQDEDRTAQAISNVVKTVVSIAALAALSPKALSTASACKPEVHAAVLRARAIKSELMELRTGGPAAKALTGKNLSDAISALATELGALQTGMLTVTSVVQETPPNAFGTITGAKPDIRDFAPLFTDLASASVTNAIDAVPNITATKLASWEAASATAGCKAPVIVPQPELVELALDDGKAGYSKTIVPMQQWGAPATLCLDIPLFKKRTVDLEWDSYGRINKLQYTAAARVETITGALSDTASQAATQFPGKTDSARLTQNATDLDNQIKIKQDTTCLNILDAGGTCPK